MLNARHVFFRKKSKPPRPDLTMKKKLYVLLFALLWSLTTTAEVQLIPLPNEIQYGKGHFVLNSDIRLMANGEIPVQTARLLNEWMLNVCGYSLPVSGSVHSRSRYVAISLLNDSTEKYTLKVSRKSILIEGGPAGLVRGVATLLQLMQHANQNDSKIPCMIIRDQPRFAYRGVHLDVCRHFVSKDFVKRYIDLIALHKMNIFHWHLTEDQGWRIEIKKYPKLTSVGAWRNGSMVGPYRDQQFDTVRYGGYYTQDDIREVVAYANQRQITIIPEIEMPGHSVAALASYPELSCTGAIKGVERGWGVFDDVFCVKDSTFIFLQDVLTEVMDLFPSKYIHIGGDECPKERWKSCPRCQSAMKENGLKDEHELQSYFIRRIERFLNSKGRQIIGWDEILEGGLAPNATVMSWRGTEGGIAAAKEKHFAVMTPGSHCYFDHYQGERGTEPLAIGGYTPLEKVYAFRPVPFELSAEESRYILGAQANLWSEYMYDSKQVEYMLLPRLCALSEVLWTDTLLHDKEDFFLRVRHHQWLLDKWKVNYSTTWMLPALEVKPGSNVPSLQLSLNSKIPQDIEYAWASPVDKPLLVPYRGGITVNSTGTLMVRSKVRDGYKIQSFPFEFSKSTGAPVRLSVSGDRNYNNPASILCDGQAGSYPWSGKYWLGWLGKNASVTIDLTKEQQIDSIVVVYLHDPVSWIHAPAAIVAYDGSIAKKQNITDRSQPVGRLSVPIGMKSNEVKIDIESIGKNPPGSAGAGEDGWMFISEIFVY